MPANKLRPLKKGADKRRASGGARPGAGRLSDQFRDKCKALARSPEFFKFAEAVLRRDKIEPRITNGHVVMVEPSVGDTVYLWEKLADRGFGKPIQALEGTDGQALVIQVVNYANKNPL